VATHRKKTADTNATLIFADESGFRLAPIRVRTWSPIGQTPVIRYRASWKKLSAFSGITSDGRLFMKVTHGSIATDQVVAFLRHLLRHIRGNIILVWDNLNTHKAKAVKALLVEHPRLSVEFLPPYAPELNPDEWVWRHLKYVELGNFGAEDTDDLVRGLRLATQRIQKRPALLEGLLRASRLFG
jgi:putative transposase